jgi:cytochrome oxidase Cu insertion factor (SCO1/SenC/PrrC family)
MPSGARQAGAGVALAFLLAAPLPQLGPAPNFALTTQRSDRIWLTHLRERAVVLTFTCTTCGECPGLLPALREVAASAGEAAGRRVFFVAVTVDPARDTPLVLRRFALAQGLDLQAWLLLTGRPAEIDVVTRRYGLTVRREGGRVAADCVVVLIDPAGTIRARYGLADLGRLGPDLHTLLAGP